VRRISWAGWVRSWCRRGHPDLKNENNLRYRPHGLHVIRSWRAHENIGGVSEGGREILGYLPSILGDERHTIASVAAPISGTPSAGRV